MDHGSHGEIWSESMGKNEHDQDMPYAYDGDFDVNRCASLLEAACGAYDACGTDGEFVEFTEALDRVVDTVIELVHDDDIWFKPFLARARLALYRCLLDSSQNPKSGNAVEILLTLQHVDARFQFTAIELRIAQARAYIASQHHATVDKHSIEALEHTYALLTASIAVI